MAKSRTKPGSAVADTAPLAPMRTVGRYFSPLEAHMVRGLLEAEGVECVLGNELFTAVDGPVALATGGISISPLPLSVSVYPARSDQIRACYKSGGRTVRQAKCVTCLSSLSKVRAAVDRRRACYTQCAQSTAWERLTHE